MPVIPIPVADGRSSGALVLERIVRDKLLLLTDNSFRRLAMEFSSSCPVNEDRWQLHGYRLSDDIVTVLVIKEKPAVISALTLSEAVS